MKNSDGNWCENRCGNQCENRCGNRCENCGKEKKPSFFFGAPFFSRCHPSRTNALLFFRRSFRTSFRTTFHTNFRAGFHASFRSEFSHRYSDQKTHHGRNCMQIYDFDSVPKFKPCCECALASSSPNKKHNLKSFFEVAIFTLVFAPKMLRDDTCDARANTSLKQPPVRNTFKHHVFAEPIRMLRAG